MKHGLDIVGFSLQAVTGIFTVVDPFTAVPVFVTLTGKVVEVPG